MNDWSYYNDFFLNIYRRKDFNVIKHEGSYLFTDKGKFLDMFSGIGVNALGGGNKEILKAIKVQSEKYLHLSNFFLTNPVGELAEYLIKNTFASKLFFSNSGTETIEATLKMIKINGNEKSKNNIIVFKNGFHGRSLGALSITPQRDQQKKVDPLLPNIIVLDYNNIEQLEKHIDNKCAGVITETIQGQGGINVADYEFIRKIRELTTKYDAIMAIDEIQSGIGRTGHLFSFEHYDIEPDIVTAAKAIGGGLPLGVLLVNKKYDSVFQVGDHGSTFGGNPLSCASGLALLKQVNTKPFLESVLEKGKYFKSNILKLKERFPKYFGSLRMKGLMIGVDIIKDHVEIEKEFEQNNIFVNFTHGNVLRILPPLNIKHEEIDIFFSAFEKILENRK